MIVVVGGGAVGVATVGGVVGQCHNATVLDDKKSATFHAGSFRTRLGEAG